MIVRVNKVLAPYVATAPDHVIPILILDMYRCNMMESVVKMIKELGVEVKHIPGGCTSLCQPVDVGLDKNSKQMDWLRHLRLSWRPAQDHGHRRRRERNNRRMRHNERNRHGRRS